MLKLSMDKDKKETVIQWGILIFSYVLALVAVLFVVPVSVPEISLPFLFPDFSLTEWASLATILAILMNGYVIYQTCEELKLDRLERKESRIYQAWEGITNPDVPGPRKVEYLEFLHGEGESFQQLSLPAGTDLFWTNKGAWFRGVQLPGADLGAADLSGVTLSFSNFSEAYISRANFQGADLSQSNFKGAELVYTDFQEADLTFSNFEGADLGCAKFKNASVLDANFQGAYLEAADMQAVINLTNEQVLSAYYSFQLPKLPGYITVEPLKVTSGPKVKIQDMHLNLCKTKD